jgi:hydrogenase maturation protease
MRGVPRVILVDASSVGVEPGTIHRVPGEQLMDLTPPEGNLHRFRWDQALGFAQWLLKDDYPDNVTVWLVEGGWFDVGAPLSAPVEAAVERVADAIVAEVVAGAASRG